MFRQQVFAYLQGTKHSTLDNTTVYGLCEIFSFMVQISVGLPLLWDSKFMDVIYFIWKFCPDLVCINSRNGFSYGAICKLRRFFSLKEQPVEFAKVVFSNSFNLYYL